MDKRANSAILYTLSSEKQAIMIFKTSLKKLWNIKQHSQQHSQICDKQHSQSYILYMWNMLQI